MRTPQEQTMFIVPEQHDGERLDVFLLSCAPRGTTRGMIQRAIRNSSASVDEKRIVKPGSVLHAGQTVRIRPDAFAPPRSPSIQPDTTLPLRILHEDPQLIVIDKPAGIPVHAGTRHAHPTVADALVARYPNLASIGEDPLRPGIVHRLDRDTSGVLLVARTPEMFATLKRKFQQRRVRKQYLALVHGVVTEDEGTVKLALKRSTRNPLRRSIARDGVGKSAETGFRVRERFAHYTLLDVFPVTGRMHQIRVHLAHLGFPIVGDQLYGKRGRDPALPAIRRQWLHAASVTLTLPSGKTGVFESPLPGELQEVLDVLREREKERTPKAPRLHFRMRSPRQTKRGR